MSKWRRSLERGMLLLIIATLLIGLWDLRDLPLPASVARKLQGAAPSNVHNVKQGGGVCQTNTPIVYVAGVIRNSGEGWYAIADESHAPLNIRSVESNLFTINVEYAFTASKVLSFVAVPDEALARNGFFVGSTVGLSSASITIARRGLFGVFRRSPAVISTRRYPLSNIWMYGAFLTKDAEWGCK